MSERDLYAALGVARSATPDEIKKAYRKLARKHHPDVNPGDAASEERFKEISVAHDTLGDPKKRRLYDEFGEDALQGGFDADAARHARAWGSQRRPGRTATAGGGDGFGFDDLFSDFFRSRGTERAQPEKGADVETSLEIDLLDAVRGANKTITLRRPGTCEPCHGEGGSGRTPCSGCGGTGEVRVGGGPITLTRKCPTCSGAGAQFASRCVVCSGTGQVSRAERLSVKIPGGIDDGSKIRLGGKGAAGKHGGKSGDVILTIKVRSHPLLERRGLDLHLDVPVTVGEAITGASLRVPTPGGDVQVKVPPKSQSGKMLRLKGRGVKDSRSQQQGDLYVRVLVQIPNDGGAEAERLAAEFEQLYGESPRAGLRL